MRVDVSRILGPRYRKVQRLSNESQLVFEYLRSPADVRRVSREVERSLWEENIDFRTVEVKSNGQDIGLNSEVYVIIEAPVGQRFASISRELLVLAKDLIANNAIEIVKKSGPNPDYTLLLHGKVWGELYYNMRGYIAENGIPIPRAQGTGKLQIGERSLSVFHREIAKANREWAKFDEG